MQPAANTKRGGDRRVENQPQDRLMKLEGVVEHMIYENTETGYAVHPESTIWVKEFTAGAFSDKMQAVGDVSDPVVSRFGVHILYYLRDIPAGRVEFNDRIRESIVNYLTNK